MLTGGCLCGAVRYEIRAEPLFAGLCHCRDCQRASGSAFLPYMGVALDSFRITGETRPHAATAARGGPSTRNFCPVCGATVYGGDLAGASGFVTVYAGTLDEPAAFVPRNQIFVRDRVGWSHVVPGSLPEFEALPG